MHAGDETYDDVPYAELVFTEVDWSEATEHLRNRSGRKDTSSEFDVEPEWATRGTGRPGPAGRLGE